MEKNSLWKSIRNNRGSGKKPTAEMIKQERKIKNKAQYGDLFSSFIKDNDDFEDEDEVYNEYDKLTPEEQEQFISTIQNQMQSGGYIKAQEGSRSPRRVETPEEKRLRLAKYNPKGGKFNKDFTLANDMDFRQSRDINVPFVKNTNSSIVLPKEISKQPTQSKKKSFVKNKVSITPHEVDRFYANKRTFNNEFTPEELDNQYQESLDTISQLNPKVDIDASSLLSQKSQLTQPVDNKTKVDDFIKGKSVTLDFDNPYEAQAIAYKKLKGNNMLSPYKGNVNLEAPSLYQESVDPYMTNIGENRNSSLQQINPNSSVGQSQLSNLYSQQLNVGNEAIGQVARNNAQNITNWLGQRAEVANRQQQVDYDLNKRYYDDVAQLQATSDENDINYMDSISQMAAKRQQAKNRFLGTAIETGIGDALEVGDNSVTFDINKMPGKVYSPTGGNQQPLGKIVNVKGVPHEYVIENGKSVLRPITIQKQHGGFTKFNMKLPLTQKSQ